MKELKVRELTKTLDGDKTYLISFLFLIHEKDDWLDWGHVGVRDKSSLLTIFAGIEAGDGDRPSVFKPQDYRIGFLAQESQLKEELSVVDAVFQGTSPLIQTVRDYEKALIQLEQNGSDPTGKLPTAEQKEAMNKNDAWNIRIQRQNHFAEIMDSDLKQPVNELSRLVQKNGWGSASVDR